MINILRWKMLQGDHFTTVKYGLKFFDIEFGIKDLAEVGTVLQQFVRIPEDFFRLMFGQERKGDGRNDAVCL